MLNPIAPLLEGLRLFDVFRGPQVGEGRTLPAPEWERRHHGILENRLRSRVTWVRARVDSRPSQPS